MAIWATDQYLQFDLSYKDTGYSVYYDYRNHKGYKSKQYSRGNVLMPGRFLTTTSDAFVSYVTAYDSSAGRLYRCRPSLVAGFERTDDGRR